jgi:hypothetical protein
VCNLVAIAEEFAIKIQDRWVKERNLTFCKNITFVTENLAIDYQNGTIDYGTFMAVFYEIQSLQRANSTVGRKRLKKLKSLFQSYASLIEKSQCCLIFDFYPAEELFYLITRCGKRYLGRKLSFKKIFLGPKEKYLALTALYTWFSMFPVRKLGKLIKGETLNTALCIKRRFYTKLVNFLKVKENYECFRNSNYSEYTLDYYLWIFMGLSKIEYYLNSSNNFETE